MLGLGAALFAWRRARAVIVELSPAAESAGPGLPAWRRLVSPVAVLFRPNAVDREKLVGRLHQAGRTGQTELDRFLEEKAGFALLGIVGGVASQSVAEGMMALLLLFIFLAAGVVLPARRVQNLIDERREAVSRALPGAVDLLMTCVDAGLSIELALARVARELSRTAPILATELGATASETEAGVSLGEALRRLSRRVDLDDMGALCTVITQSHELGAPIVQTLADFSDSTRKKRMATLEERAGKLVTKLTVPLAVFLLPAALVAMLGAAGLQLIEALK
jgi:tight adherence protein C